MNYDWRITIAKAVKAAAISLGAGVAAASLAYLSDPATVTKALGSSVAPAVAAIAVPLITAAAHAGLNWLKNRG